jgi:hypothetical protein
MWRGTSSMYRENTYSGKGLTPRYRSATTASNPNENAKVTSSLSYSSTLSGSTSLLVIRTLIRISVYLIAMVIRQPSSRTSLRLLGPATSTMTPSGRKRLRKVTPFDGRIFSRHKCLALIALNIQKEFGRAVVQLNTNKIKVRTTTRIVDNTNGNYPQRLSTLRNQLHAQLVLPIHLENSTGRSHNLHLPNTTTSTIPRPSLLASQNPTSLCLVSNNQSVVVTSRNGLPQRAR